ncbi:MAG TPA: hypothetical protein VNR68_00165 [Sphingomicrobium sp.]|nr:hypothetical protein [Sphingomicrobium sp.]
MMALLAFAVATQSAVVSTSGGGHSAITITVPLGQTAKFNRTPVRPVRIVEDSRCPIDVTCVWRGRLRVEVMVGQVRRPQTLVLEDGKAVPFAGGSLMLVGSRPAKRANGPPPRSFILRYDR